MARKTDRPIADIRFYQGYLVARTSRLTFSYKVILLMILLIMVLVLSQVGHFGPTQTLQILKAIVSALK